MTLFFFFFLCFESEEEALSRKGIGEVFLCVPTAQCVQKWDDFSASMHVNQKEVDCTYILGWEEQQGDFVIRTTVMTTIPPP